MHDEILDTASKLFIKLGYKSVTMVDIAHELSISKKTLYKFYESKDKLVKDVASCIKNDLFRKLKDTISFNHNPVKENFEIQRIMIDIFQRIPASARYELMKYYPDTYCDEVTEQNPKLIDYLIQNIQRGKVSGYYLKDIDETYCAKLNFILLSSYENHFKIHFNDLEFHEKTISFNIRAIATHLGEESLNELFSNSDRNNR